MDRIESPDGLFHEGNPAQGVKGTKVTAIWLNAIQEIALGAGGNIQTMADTYTLLEGDGVLFANPPEGATVLYNLPVYATAGALKRYKVKNIGLGIATLNAIDGKTIDGLATLDLLPGDKCEVAKDGANWQTI
ncbi:MAG: hypothetical protein M0T70_06795 [Geobacteraceae bacterium]|nr:hypothetical protein [Geobacteraceae bacterium]